MIRPRCKHHSVGRSIQLCTGCRATFVDPDLSVGGREFVAENPARPGAYRVRRGAFWTVFGSAIVIGLLGTGSWLVSAALTYAPVVRALVLLFAGVLLVLAYVTVRDRIGPASIAADERGLSVGKVLSVLRRRARISRPQIIGVWVQCVESENGLTGPFDVASDLDSMKTKLAVQAIPDAVAAIFLAERLAEHLHMTADTRARG